MKFKETNITQFKSINELYSFIDDNSFELKKNYELSDIWVRYKNHSNIELEKKKSQWEIDCFSFDLKSNILFSQIYSEGKNISEIDKYPDLNKFNSEIVEYIKFRISFSKSTILNAHYNHLLWKCPTGIKRTSYALSAIKNYILSIEKYLDLFEKSQNKDLQYQIGQLFENLVCISNELKFDKTELKKITKRILFKTIGLEFYVIHNILFEMLEHTKIFKAIDFENSLEIFEKALASTTEIDDFLFCNEYFNTAISIAKKVKTDHKKWHNLKGLSFLKLADNIVNQDSYWVKQSYYAKAITEFKLSKNTINKENTEKLYADLKPLIKIPKITIPFTKEIQEKLKKHNENIKRKANKLLNFEPEYIYSYISKGHFFPDYDSILTASKGKDNFLEYITSINFDLNNNIVKEKTINKELKKVYDVFQDRLNETVLPYLHYIIIKGIKSGKLNYKNFIKYLIEHTWIGKIDIRYDLGGQEQEVNWIEQLCPAIIEFFLQIQAWSNSKYYKPSFILCTDSLTLKIEGIFRNFCERVKIPTSIDKEKGMQEIYINNILEMDIIADYFNEDDRLFFGYLFSNNGGLNLRNNIAHCFYNSKDYHLDKMLLLIAVLLRIGKYNQTKNKKNI